MTKSDRYKRGREAKRYHDDANERSRDLFVLDVGKVGVAKNLCDNVPRAEWMLLDHFHIDRVAILHIEALLR